MRFLEFLRSELGSLNWGLAIVRRFRMGGIVIDASTDPLTIEDGTTPLTIEDGTTGLTLEG